MEAANPDEQEGDGGCRGVGKRGYERGGAAGTLATAANAAVATAVVAAVRIRTQGRQGVDPARPHASLGSGMERAWVVVGSSPRLRAARARVAWTVCGKKLSL